MELDLERELLVRCGLYYNSGGMPGLEKFIKSYSGTPEEISFLDNLKNLITILNSNGRTRIMCFSYNSIGQILEHGICFSEGSDRELQDKIADYKIIFSNNSR